MEQHPIKINKVQIRNLQIEDYVQLSQSFTRVYSDGSDVFWRMKNNLMSATHRHSLPEAVPRSASRFSSLSAALSSQNALTFLLFSGTFQYPGKVSL